MRALRSPDKKRRLIALGGVLSVHLALLALLLSGMPRIAGVRDAPREIFFSFAPLPKPRETSPPAPVPSPAPAAPSRTRPVPPEAGIAPNPQARGVDVPLFRCAPQDLADLSPEERDRCAAAFAAPVPRDAIPGTVREHAVDADRWSAAIASRNAPVTMPCSYLKVIHKDVIYGMTDTAVMVDPLCALGLKTGH